MLRIDCPNCGARDVFEFDYIGEVGPRPDPNEVDLLRWRDHLYGERNPMGWVLERWYHRAGCRRFLTVDRHTASNEVRSVEPVTATAHPTSKRSRGQT